MMLLLSPDYHKISPLEQPKNESNMCLSPTKEKHSRYNCPNLVLNDKKEKGVGFGFSSNEACGSLCNIINRTNGFIKYFPERDISVIFIIIGSKG